MKIPELLSPAGSRDSLRAAVLNGCNAVYLGGKSWSARAGADNFDADELEETIDYCHIRGVKVYITVNTLYKDDELGDVTNFCERAYRVGADAFIVQDMGAAFFIRKSLPDIKLIASTQASIGDELGVKLLAGHFDRVIIAREASLDDIRRITALGIVETEVFVHGALCVCHSGQCLMSSWLGGRSGNRGRCAQPCRMRYELMNRSETIAKGYLLSPRDLCALTVLPEIVEAGVDSIKIEGRMKSPEYVALTTGLYRAALDRIQAGDKSEDSDAIDKLLRVFNRGGAFTSGYFKNHNGIRESRATLPSMMSFETPKNTGVYIGCVDSFRVAANKAFFRTERDLTPGDGIEIWTEAQPHAGGYITAEYKAGSRVTVDLSAKNGRSSGARINAGDKVYLTYDKRLMDELRRAASADFSDMGKLHVSASVSAEIGKPCCLELNYNGIRAAACGAICKPAVNRPLTAAEIKARLGKTGQTPFVFEFSDIRIDDNLFIGIRELNELRRDAAEMLQNEIIRSSKRAVTSLTDRLTPIAAVHKRSVGRPALSVLVSGAAQLHAAVNVLKQKSGILPIADSIIFELHIAPLPGVAEALQTARSKGVAVYAAMPWTICGVSAQYMRQLNALLPAGVTPDGFLLRNPGQLQYFKESYTGQPVLTADHGFNVFNSLTADYLLGLGLDRITLSPELSVGQLRVTARPEADIFVYGRLPLMTTNQCPIGNMTDSCPRQTGTDSADGNGFPGSNNGFSLGGFGEEFPVLTDCRNCVARIYSGKPIFTLDKLGDVLSVGAGSLRLAFTNESAEDTSEILQAYMDCLDSGRLTPEARRLSENMRNSEDSRAAGRFIRGVL